MARWVTLSRTSGLAGVLSRSATAQASFLSNRPSIFMAKVGCEPAVNALHHRPLLWPQSTDLFLGGRVCDGFRIASEWWRHTVRRYVRDEGVEGDQGGFARQRNDARASREPDLEVAAHGFAELDSRRAGSARRGRGGSILNIRSRTSAPLKAVLE